MAVKGHWQINLTYEILTQVESGTRKSRIYRVKAPKTEGGLKIFVSFDDVKMAFAFLSSFRQLYTYLWVGVFVKVATKINPLLTIHTQYHVERVINVFYILNSFSSNGLNNFYIIITRIYFNLILFMQLKYMFKD